MPRKLQTSSRKSATQARAKATVEAILQGAARVLRAHGYDRASTNRIAAAAGVSIGSLYQYFPGKEAIVAALMERHIDKVFGVVEAQLQALAGAPLADAVPCVVAVFFDAAAVDPQLRRVFIAEVPRVGKLGYWQAVEGRVAELAQAYLAARRREVARRDLALTAFVIVRAVAALTYEAALTPARFSRDALVAEISDMILAHLSAAG